MSSADVTREQIQKLLEPYILPREETAYRRRILAAHLESCVGDGTLSRPLALVQPVRSVSIPAEARGLHKEYLDALNANISARAEYAKFQAEISRDAKTGCVAPGANTVSDRGTSNPLEDHLLKLRLQRKQERLRTVEKHIASLNHKPAASATFLDPEEILRDTQPLPDVPREVVESLALGGSTGKANLTDLIDRLEKQVLRAKLLLKSEEKLLNAVKARSTVRPGDADDNAKLHALNATRTELINWMETELSKVPADEEDLPDETNPATTTQPPHDSSHTDDRLADIRSKYAQYLAARKSLLHLVSQQPPTPPPAATLPKPLSAADQDPSANPPPPQPATYLLTPYLERLLSLAREQKALIAQKSHLNTAITKQLGETAQLLDHLADESNLLSSHPAATEASGQRRLLGFAEALGSLKTSDRVRPWVYAADSAKIATLEAVAERIEEGQVALEGSMGLIREMERVLGRRLAGDGDGERGDAAAEEDGSDIWLAEGRPSRAGGVGKRHARKESKAAARDTDLWGFLDGALGLLKGGEEQDLLVG